MESTMPDIPLNVARILDYGRTVHGSTTVTSYSRGELDTTTFAEIGARAAALAHALHDVIGARDDDRVATLMFNCTEQLETMFATMCSGLVFVPLNKQLMDDQIIHIINHSGSRVLVADPKLAPILLRVVPHCPQVHTVIVTGFSVGGTGLSDTLPAVDILAYEQLLDGQSTSYDWPVIAETEAASICYSTGTTGAPKGVAYSHRSIYLHALGLRTTDSFAVSHGQKFLCCVPIYHVLSWGVPVAAFMCGAPLVFPGSDVSPQGLARIIKDTHPRVANGVPTLWISLMVHYLEHPPERMSLQEIFVGGSPAPPILIKMWEEHYGVDVIHIWGMTETSPIGTVARPPSGAGGETRWSYRISQGRFPASMQYRVVSDGEEVTGTDRNQGEIQVRGNWVTASYWHPDTQEEGGAAHRFRGADVDDAEEKFTDDGWLKTGDVGSVSRDGFLTIEDRKRDVIRSGGEWIYSVPLENLVMEHPDVVEAAVIGYPDDKWGERPLAVTVVLPGVATTEETAARLRDHLKNRSLPGWMLPEYWTFVDRIDKTSVDKFDKKDLRQHLRDGEFDIIKLKGPGER
ncbi:long-chain fatty-acid--CoA ligase [Corynebacterium mendelii]|uniref:Long-chain fatty-acid--CoA ligase n=1 Tax=Corynebacterium mendelii TaxID=2765362 RepID=A0A939E1F3_9CORY|nr:long-chain fatty-acid--CoA ligase [Corynebacterium mendelii]MBN9644938.1 long-chain fatty-acid--CoA ligase [Corynebacterium mendelii]